MISFPLSSHSVSVGFSAKGHPYSIILSRADIYNPISSVCLQDFKYFYKLFFVYLTLFPYFSSAWTFYLLSVRIPGIIVQFIQHLLQINSICHLYIAVFFDDKFRESIF